MPDLATLASPPAAAARAPARSRPSAGATPWATLLTALPRLAAADMQALDALCGLRDVASGDWVFTHRTPARALLLLLDGSVSLGHRSGAAMAPESLLRGPAWLDASSCWLGGHTHALDARAMSAVCVGEIERPALQALLLRRPMLAPGFLAVLAEQIERLSLQAHELMHMDANARLAAWLHRRLAPSPDGDGLLRLVERKRDIASQLGMSPETLSRQMRQLVGRGLIEVDGYQIRVLDVQALQRLAQG